MAVGKTLAQVLTQACYELGQSAQSALNQDVREQLKGLIVAEQERRKVGWSKQNALQARMKVEVATA